VTALRIPEGDAARGLLAVQDALEAGEPLLITGLAALAAVEDRALRRLVAATCDALRAHPQPVLAASDEPLLDTGLEVALACDLRFVRRGVEVGLPATLTGWLPCGGGQRLLRLAGTSLATRMLLLGETVRAGAEVERFMTVVDDALPAAAVALEQVAARGPLALEALASLIRSAAELPLSAGAAIEADLACLLLDTADRAEGLEAFRARRSPRFEGR